jgi:hypothetical protein
MKGACPKGAAIPTRTVLSYEAETCERAMINCQRSFQGAVEGNGKDLVICVSSNVITRAEGRREAHLKDELILLGAKERLASSHQKEQQRLLQEGQETFRWFDGSQ